MSQKFFITFCEVCFLWPNCKILEQYIMNLLFGGAESVEAYQGSVAVEDGWGIFSSSCSFFFFLKNMLSYFSSTSSSIYTITPPLSCTAITGNKPPMIRFILSIPACCMQFQSRRCILWRHATQHKPGNESTPPPFQKPPQVNKNSAHGLKFFSSHSHPSSIL